MKICPNCDFENFTNPDYCEGCGVSLQNVRTEFFTILDFINKNSAVYAVTAIFLGLFQYFFSSSDTTIKNISLFPLFVAIYLLFALFLKGDRIVRTQAYDTSHNHFFNENSFQLWVFLSINLLLILGLLWITGIQFILSICIIGTIVVILSIFFRRISLANERLSFTIWLNLLGFLFFEIGCLVFLYIPPVLRTITDPTLWFWTLMIPLLLIFFGIGTILGNMFINAWIFLTGQQQNAAEHHAALSFDELFQEARQYIQVFNEHRVMRGILVLIILMAIWIITILFFNQIMCIYTGLLGFFKIG